jgi:NTP pyrophosphatase (non-canonical NTP hydrolase)
MSFEELTGRLRAFAAARDWGQYHTPKNLVMALSGEVGELITLFQWLTPDQAARAMRDPRLAADIKDEMADVLLYLVQLADTLGVDLDAVAHAKIDRNEDRFPATGP